MQTHSETWLQCRWPVVGTWLRRRALRHLRKDGSAQACRVLAGAAAEPLTVPADEAFAVLVELADAGNTPAREALCRLVIHHDHPAARRHVLAAGYRPHDETMRALFLFLTGQWQAYEELDFEHTLLRAAYLAGSRTLQQRIAACARQAGRVEWVDVAAGGRQGLRLNAMTEREWQTIRNLLSEGSHWPELWRLAQQAPPRWSARFLQRLHEARWSPSVDARAGYRELTSLAQRWQDRDYRALMRCRAMLTGHTGEVRCLTLCRSGRLLASGSADGTVRLWSLPEGKELHVLEGHRGGVTCLAASPDGRWLISAGKDRTVCLWALPEGRLHGKLQGHARSLSCLAIRPQGDIIISGGLDGRVQLWGLPDGEALPTLDDHDAAIQALSVTPDGTLLASGSADSTVMLWRLPDGKRLRTLAGHRQERLDAVLCLAIDARGRWLASGATDHTAQLWSLPDGGHVARLDEHLGHVSCLAFSPSGDRLITGSHDQMLRFWNVPDGTCKRAVEAHAGEVAELAFSRDGELLVSRCGPGPGHDHAVRLWSLPEGRLLRCLYGHDRFVNCFAFSPDGQFLATGSADRTIRLWTAELARLSTLPPARVTPTDLDWLERALGERSLSNPERAALQFVSALVRWRKRGDILLEDVGPQIVQVGAFDIEIAE